MKTDRDFITPMQQGIPPMAPDPLSADEAEHGVCAMVELPELSESQMAEGHATEERR